jgi:hypothetical protein
MRFVHTSDWQVGKTFRFGDDASQLLRDERLEVVTRLGRLARAEGAATILVAGNVYDIETPAERTLRQPIERMRGFPDIEWHLIPGNHDAHTPRGPWERLLRLAALEQMHAPDPDEDVVHVPLVPWPWPAASQVVGKALAEFSAPVPYGLVRDDDAPARPKAVRRRAGRG